MKIRLTDIIKTGNINPFKWGDSADDLLKVFPAWKGRVEDLQDAQCPYIEIDSVEFYFEKDHYQHLNEIVIKLWNFNRHYQSDFFELDWLKTELNFPQVMSILNREKWAFELVTRPENRPPIILPNRNTQFAFDWFYDDKYDENETELQKVDIRQSPLETTYLNLNAVAITHYNGD